MKPNQLSYMSGSASVDSTTLPTDTTGTGTTNSVNDGLAITQSVFTGISDMLSLFGGVIRDTVKSGQQALTERRKIMQENLFGLFNLDTNKNTNLGFVIILGIAVIALICFKFAKDLKK